MWTLSQFINIKRIFMDIVKHFLSAEIYSVFLCTFKKEFLNYTNAAVCTEIRMLLGF